MSLLDGLLARANRILEDPRVIELLRSEQLISALTLVAELPDRLGVFTAEQGERFAKNLHLATENRVAELERRVAELEARLQQFESRSQS